MKRVSLRLPDSLDAKLSSLARKQQRTKSEIVRAALEASLANSLNRRQPTAYELSRDLCGSVTDAPPDLSSNRKYLEAYGRGGERL